MTRIINLTQHTATQSQLDAGVEELKPELKERLLKALNFIGVPTYKDIQEAADEMYHIMHKYSYCYTCIDVPAFMVGGHPALMCALTQFSSIYRMKFAASDRVSEEVIQEDGSVRKINVFKHIGFINMYCPPEY